MKSNSIIRKLLAPISYNLPLLFLNNYLQTASKTYFFQHATPKFCYMMHAFQIVTLIVVMSSFYSYFSVPCGK